MSWQAWVFIILVLYFLGVGVFYQVFTSYCKNNCENYNYKIDQVPFSAMWPIFTIIFFGRWIGTYMTGFEDRKKLNHERKMAELAANRELHEVNLRLLETAGVKARP